MEPSAIGAWVTSSVAMQYVLPGLGGASVGPRAQRALIEGSIHGSEGAEALAQRRCEAHPAPIAGDLEQRHGIVDRRQGATAVAERDRRLGELGRRPAAMANHAVRAAQL